MNDGALIQMRKDKDAFFKKHPQSPLTPQQQAKFDGLTYYPPNEALALTVTVDELEEKQQFLMKTNHDDLRPFLRFGTFEVTVDGETDTLTLFESYDGHYFLPFVDANAGTETYDAGRYLDLHPNGDGTFDVDFNLAYNPYCAYNDLFVCPITPAENRLSIAIEAGEKIPAGDWVDKH